ncbi:hypothetical protein [Polaromonas sp. YR568]|uniref:hypothetical protein n=1 Tax=Polaromonas sp. YR568 TaxID=1855301 RepID=UPI00398C114E
MKIVVDSREYKAWHEVGHATVCLHLGGDVELIEFLENDSRGHARTQCVVSPEHHKSVACGGFAAEFYLLNEGLAELAPDDKRDINRVVFHNSIQDREDFWARQLGEDEIFSIEEDHAFMNHALGNVLPIFAHYLPGMHKLAQELSRSKRVEGELVKRLLRSHQFG